MTILIAAGIYALGVAAGILTHWLWMRNAEGRHVTAANCGAKMEGMDDVLIGSGTLQGVVL